MLRRLAEASACAAIERLDGETLLGERAMLANWSIPGSTSAGGGTRLFQAIGDNVALNLSRPDDRAMLAALFEVDALDGTDTAAVSACIRRCEAEALVRRGRSMGLAIAMEHEAHPPPAVAGVKLIEGLSVQRAAPSRPRVVDLSALWAGPLAAHLLWLTGAEVVKVESRTRPDGMRSGDPTFHGLLNQGKYSAVVDFSDAGDRQALRELILRSDIVIEAARPRGLAQLGIDAREFVATTPGLVWLTITAHGARDETAEWVGFGDDCSVAAGLSAALRTATGRSGFVGDAIADPLTGIAAALLGWNSWQAGKGGRFGLALSQVTADCLRQARANDPEQFSRQLAEWGAATGQPFPTVLRRTISAAVAGLGEDTHRCLAFPHQPPSGP